MSWRKVFDINGHLFYTGQFWNIPITIRPYVYTGSDPDISEGFDLENLYEFTVDHPDEPPRRFVGDLYDRTWAYRTSPCYYVGNFQGGPLSEFESPSDSVIQGRYTHYRVRGLHDTEFMYTRFEQDLCDV